MKTYKTVNSQGLAWRVHSENERSITHSGRHFYASRCRSGRPWSIREHDQCIATHGSARPLRVWANRYDINQLSDAIRCIVGEMAGHHPSKAFDEHHASLTS